MLHNKATSAHYDRERKAVVVEFADGSAGIWPVRLLEMVRYDGVMIGCRSKQPRLS
ncbi:hypothetical protein [cf. Phormidesmis sp. LEGE 11477]|uniref:hypothetical protein n=1 Tax=cf. Phormidesmis sp. LEGE 11477 TaxID=1828680 RepID=UPI001882005F|nr:hypothetical protein [cf. Phormidesmis sp. LEGE 11477]MBE9060983.1 hypothetical protein [cf. Phormidesmis sp. LEGE 11477]